MMRGDLRDSAFGPGVVPAWLAEHDLEGVVDAPDEDTHGLKLLSGGHARIDQLEREVLLEFGRWRRSSGVNAEDVTSMLVPGIVSGVSLVLRGLTSLGSTVVVASPNHAPLATAVSRNGRKVAEWPMLRSESDWSYDFDALEELFRSDPSVEAVVVSDPNNPTGRRLQSEEVEQIGRLATDHQKTLVFDEAMLDLVRSPRSALAFLGDGCRVISASSAVKAWSLGDIATAMLTFSHSSDADNVRAELEALHWRPNANGLVLTLRALQSEPKSLVEVRNHLSGDWQTLKEALPEWSGRYLPSEGLVGLVAVDGLGIDDRGIESSAMQAGVALRGPERFYGGLSQLARISVGQSRPGNETLASRLAAWLSQ